MAIQSAKFQTQQVEGFLNKVFPWAAAVFATEHTGSRMIESVEVQKWFEKRSTWFERWFPETSAESLYRQLECEVPQYVELERGGSK